MIIHIEYTLYMYSSRCIPKSAHRECTHNKCLSIEIEERCVCVCSYFFVARICFVQSFSRCLGSGLFLSLPRLHTDSHYHCNFLAPERTTRCSSLKIARTQTAYSMRFGRADIDLCACVCVRYRGERLERLGPKSCDGWCRLNEVRLRCVYVFPSF